MSPSSFILRPSSVKRGAFTLVELMVSIALALLLLVGVNQVFKTTTATVGTGYATSQVMREHLAVEKVLARDVEKAAGPSAMPAIVIHSEQIYAFQDRNDLNSDPDQNVQTADIAGTGTEQAIKASDYGTRSHRIDTVSFFAKDIDDPYRRQTADQPATGIGSELTSSEQSSEAWIWIGHLRMPRDTTDPDPRGYTTGDYFSPGQSAGTGILAKDAATNPNNYFANDWALGREAILLKAQPSGDYIQNTGVGLSPLDLNSVATKSVPDFTKPPGADKGFAWQIPHARFDIAATTIAKMQAAVKTAQAAPNWYLTLDYRFNGKPWITRSSNLLQLGQELSQTTAFLTRGCTQFMVEFAGDFVTQDNDPTSATYGRVLSAQPDGVLDFNYVAAIGVRRTQWYGFPRDTGGNAAPPPAANNGAPDGHITKNYDVVPVRDIAGATMSFEKVLPAQAADYGKLTGTLAANQQYICAWGPNELNPASGYPSRPWMLRFVLQLTDPNGRLGEGRVVEYVYTLPQY